MSIPTYVINLAERVDKRQKMEKRLAKITSIRPKLFPAIKHNNGSIGCLLSHQMIVGIAKQLNYDMVLVIEDDCLFCPDFDQRWTPIVEWLRKNMDKWDVFNGGITNVNHNMISVVNKKLNIVRARGLRTQFIVYNSCIYDKILELSTSHIIDKFTKHHCRMLVTIPFLSIQQATNSDIKKRFRDDRKSFFKTELAISKVL
jgi:GR25 family glycosyltransferase involved in LPS biosynthesis